MWSSMSSSFSSDARNCGEGSGLALRSPMTYARPAAAAAPKNTHHVSRARTVLLGDAVVIEIDDGLQRVSYGVLQ